MGRPVILGNGALTVGLNECGEVHDFYYPYVGLDNLSTSRSSGHKIGVWVDGNFSWVSDPGWQTDVNFDDDALISNISLVNEDLAVELGFRDFVDPDQNVFFRQITIKNKGNKYKNVRLFMHQVFEISRRGRADTALFVPDERYILDYKGRCSLLVYGQSNEGVTFDQYAIGNYGIEGKTGTYADAEDGELSNNNVEHGGVDSVIRFPCPLSAGAETVVDYWIVAAEAQSYAEKLHHKIQENGLDSRLVRCRQYWKEWLEVGNDELERIDGKYLPITRKSLMLIKAHTDKRGGIIASCDSSIYNFGRDYYSYVWPRDGAYAIWPLIRLGYTYEPKRFFEFCRDIISPGGYLMHKFQPDRAIGSTWHPLVQQHRTELAIQEDETAGVIYMLGEFYNRNPGDKDFIGGLYGSLIQPAANFMSQFIDEQTGLPHASYDLWEEKFLTTSYTSALVVQALLVAADFAEMFDYPDDDVRWRDAAGGIERQLGTFYKDETGYLAKGYLLDSESGELNFDNTLDASTAYAGMLYMDSKQFANQISQTISAIEDQMLDETKSLGCPRYPNDNYFKQTDRSNPWFITTFWLAQYYVRQNRPIKARDYIDWAINHSLSSGAMSEQVHPDTGAPLSVAPLVWSHSELINTVLDLNRVN